MKKKDKKKLKSSSAITIQLRKQNNRNTEASVSVLSLFFSCICLTCASFVFAEITLGGLGFDYYRLSVLCALIIVNLLYTCIMQMQKTFLALLGIFLIIYLFFGFLLREDIFRGMLSIYDEIARLINILYGASLPASGISYADSKSLSVAIIFLTFLVSAIYHLVVHTYKKCWIVFAGNGLPIALLLLLSFSPGTISLLLYILSGTGLWLYCLLSRQTSGSIRTHGTIYGIFSGSALLCIAAAGALSLFGGISSTTILSVKTEVVDFYRSHNLYRYQGTIGSDNGTTASGGVAGGSLGSTEALEFKNETHLRVYTDEKPTTRVYLKAYIGNEYTGNGWNQTYDEQTDDLLEDALLQVLTSDLSFSSAYIDIADLTKSRFTLSPYAASGSGIESSFSSDIDDDAIITHWRYFPAFYGLTMEERTGFSVMDRMQSEDLAYITDVIANDFLSLPDDVSRYQEYFNKYSYDNLPDFTEPHALEELYEYIKVSLSEMTTYSLNPGAVPEGEDFTAYFLFDNQKGFCMHYASAATILFRLHGVPARYVEGYISSPSDYREQDNGLYMAQIKDSRAHAWTEVYLNGSGWVPLEVTATYTDNPASPESPASAQDPLELPEIPDTDQPDATSDSTEEDNKDPASDEKDTSGSDSENNVDLRNMPLLVYAWSAAAVILLLLVSVISVICRRRWILKKKRSRIFDPDTRQSVIFTWQELLAVYRFLGEPEDSASEHHRDAMTIVYKTAYSTHTLSEEEKNSVIQAYNTFSGKTYASLPRFKKILFNYIYCFYYT